MNPDLFMELLYDFVTGVAQVDGAAHTSVEAGQLEFRKWPAFFSVRRVEGGNHAWTFVWLYHDPLSVSYSMQIESHAAEGPRQAVTSAL